MTISRTFGKRGGHVGGIGSADFKIPFGKRSPGALTVSANDERDPFRITDFVSVARLRLLAVCRDISNLYHDPASSHDEPVCRMVDGTDARLLIGHHAAVSVDPVRGVYVLAISCRSGDMTVETASEDILLDHIIGHLALDRGRYLSLSAHSFVAQFVGNSLHDMERSLILATLRQYHFNRTRAAEVLGVSVRTIRNRLKCYRRDTGDGRADADIFHLRASPPGA